MTSGKVLALPVDLNIKLTLRVLNEPPNRHQQTLSRTLPASQLPLSCAWVLNKALNKKAPFSYLKSVFHYRIWGVSGKHCVLRDWRQL